MGGLPVIFLDTYGSASSDFWSILKIGFSDGLIWFPIVLGVGLLYTYFKEIDISVDGIAVLSGIACAFVWRTTESYTLSILAGILIGISGATLTCLFQTFLRIPSLMAGIVFSLAAHSISVLVIGESLVLPNTRLINGFGVIPWWQIPLVAMIIFSTIIFYSTKFGVAARKLGNGCQVNTLYSAGFLKWTGYALSGFLYGLGGAIYAHSQGVAKSGGSFEFLLVALSAYLLIVRIWDLVRWFYGLIFGAPVKRLFDFYLFKRLHPSFAALFGAITMETGLFFTIATAPNPMSWKVYFAILLLVALANPDFHTSFGLSGFRTKKALNKLEIENLFVHYDIGAERRQVFNNASADFSIGVNLIRGPNGTGKSTLLRTIAGIIKPSEGKIKYNGNDLLRVSSHARPCFLVQQNPMDTLAPELTVTDNLFAVFCKAGPLAYGFDKHKVIAELASQLERLGISPIKPENDIFWLKPVMTLSGGEAHCVALYCAMLSGAPILLADEPTTGLDTDNFERLVTIIKALSADHIILLTSHDDRMTVFADEFLKVGSGMILLNKESTES